MIEFKRHSGIYTLSVKQKLPTSVEEAWEFLSDPINLALITPEHMNFEITSNTKKGSRMFEGQIISYRVSPFPGLGMNWVTEITHVMEPRYFVDEQRFGPYKMWHHEHWIEEINDGVEILDRVSYKIPLGIIGHLAQSFLVKKQLREIFEYRFYKLSEVFGKYSEPLC